MFSDCRRWLSSCHLAVGIFAKTQRICRESCGKFSPTLSLGLACRLVCKAITDLSHASDVPIDRWISMFKFSTTRFEHALYAFNDYSYRFQMGIRTGVFDPLVFVLRGNLPPSLASSGACGSRAGRQCVCRWGFVTPPRRARSLAARVGS